MDDFFFKARLKWERGILSLTDTEAGRLMKAVWAFASTGEEADLSGKEDGVYQMIIGDLAEDADRRNTISEVRREAANSRWNKQNNTNDANASDAMQSNANNAIKSNINSNSHIHSNINSKNRPRVLNASNFTQREYADGEGDMDRMMEGQA